jgi:ribosomal protein S27E
MNVAINDMLGQSYKLGRHTDVFVLIVSDGSALQISKYAWTHIDFKPWGGFLPIQCPGCGFTDAWRSVYNQADKAYTFECCNDSCRERYIFKQPQGAKMLTVGRNRGSGWMEVPLPIG